MLRKPTVWATAVVLGVGGLAASAYAHGFGGHRYGEGMSAIRPCIVVMSPAQRANLKQIFSTQKDTLMTDHQNVENARKTLAGAIVSGTKDVSSQESALATAQQQLQKDMDATAAQVCGQLNSSQLSAAQTLFNNLAALHANSRQQARSYFTQAKAAAGDSAPSSTTPSSSASD